MSKGKGVKIMYGYILFKNIRGTTKLNLQLSKPLDSLDDISDSQATIIQYITNKNNYNFTLSNELDTVALTLDEKALNLDYIYNQVND